MTANIEYVQQNILELKNELIAVEDARVGNVVCNPRECKYIMEHLLHLVGNMCPANMRHGEGGGVGL